MILTKLENILNEIMKELNYDFVVSVKKSNRLDLCDYQCDDVFKLAKTYSKSPIEIGEEIAKQINKMINFSDFFKMVEFVKPGFINITVSDKIVNQTLENMMTNNKFGLSSPKKIETYFLDYGGPNVAKPLHVGHVRSAIVGESIKRIIDYMGHITISDVHLGDYGLQIGQVIYGIKTEKPEVIDLDFLDYIYPKMSALCKENEELKEKCASITKELQDGNEEYKKLWKTIFDISSEDIKRQYRYLSISFDIWEGESDAYPYIEPLTEILNSKNLLKESEGAKVIEVKDDTDKTEIPPLIYQKSNGAYLYGTTDLATILKRVQNNHIDHMIYVADLRQTLHFKQVFRSAILAGLSPNTTYEFCGFGTVNGIDGKPFKTRSGNVPKLDGLFREIEEIFKNSKETNKNMNEKDIEIIANSIIKFADLQNSKERDYIFDIEKFSEVVGKTGPYILYTYLRSNKILNEHPYSLHLTESIYNENDRCLRLKLIELELSLVSAFKEKMPSLIAEYVYELCVLSNAFYQNNHINTLEDQNQKNDWLSLLYLTNKVIKEMLNLLIIEIPTKM